MLKQKKHDEVIIDRKVAKVRGLINKLIAKKKYEDSLQLISALAQVLYVYNQFYTDEQLENILQFIMKQIDKETNNIDLNIRWRDDTVIFYDGFGFETRGLVLIYLKALSNLGYRIIYIVSERVRGKVSLIEKLLLEKNNSKIVYYPKENIIKSYKTICAIFSDEKAKNAFLYTAPDDVVGIMAFMHYEGLVNRFQINLTDHAFWLGVNAFDYCLEFRSYGAAISAYYRNIPANKLLIQPYYPMINKECEFAGFPFEAQKDDFIIFSGGSLYKTFDTNMTYYKIVEYCINESSRVKFWYAGSGNVKALKYLKSKYPEQVFYTSERKDLFNVLQNVHLYLNTYPIGGGLMMQYSVVAGRIPITLRFDDEISGILLNQNKLGIEFNSFEEVKHEISKLIRDNTYRNQKEERLKNNAVISESAFEKNLFQIINEKNSSFNNSIENIETQKFREIYFERFGNLGFEKAFARRQNIGMIKYLPRTILLGILLSVLDKMGFMRKKII